MRTLGLTLIALFIATGCAGVSPYARASAGRVGCSAESIEISQQLDEGGGPRSWVAACGGNKYACSSNGDPGGGNAKVVCSEIGGEDHGRRHGAGHDHDHHHGDGHGDEHEGHSGGHEHEHHGE